MQSPRGCASALTDRGREFWNRNFQKLAGSPSNFRRRHIFLVAKYVLTVKQLIPNLNTSPNQGHPVFKKNPERLERTTYLVNSLNDHQRNNTTCIAVNPSVKCWLDDWYAKGIPKYRYYGRATGRNGNDDLVVVIIACCGWCRCYNLQHHNPFRHLCYCLRGHHRHEQCRLRMRSHHLHHLTVKPRAHSHCHFHNVVGLMSASYKGSQGVGYNRSTLRVDYIQGVGLLTSKWWLGDCPTVGENHKKAHQPSSEQRYQCYNNWY